MLKDYEFEFCVALHKKLKEKVKGKVFTTISKDELIVRINMGKFQFQMGFDNFTQKLSEGLSTDAVIVDVIKTYREDLIEYMNKIYFINEGR